MSACTRSHTANNDNSRSHSPVHVPHRINAQRAPRSRTSLPWSTSRGGLGSCSCAPSHCATRPPSRHARCIHHRTATVLRVQVTRAHAQARQQRRDCPSNTWPSTVAEHTHRKPIKHTCLTRAADDAQSSATTFSNNRKSFF